MKYRLFGTQYVLLKMMDGDRKLCRAYTLGNDVYAHPYTPDTRCKLLPDGGLMGQPYVVGWEPVTDKTMELYGNED